MFATWHMDIRRQNHAKPNSIAALASANPGVCFRTWRPLRCIALRYCTLFQRRSISFSKQCQCWEVDHIWPCECVKLAQSMLHSPAQPTERDHAWPKCFNCLDFRLSQGASQCSECSDHEPLTNCRDEESNGAESHTTQIFHNSKPSQDT